MSENLNPYSSYKTINLLWLDKIPSHWDITRNKNVMKLKKNIVGEQHSKYTLLSLTLNGIIPRDIESGKGKFPKDFSTYQIVENNDLVFCLFDIDETPRTVGLATLQGMITGAYTVFNVINANPKYLFYYYLSLDQSKLLKPLYTGLRKVISTDTFLRTKLPLPPRTEQEQIVRYLDSKLMKINKFIKAKKKLIETLNEQKQAIIYNAVTNGVEEYARKKPSGLETLGDIPEHWEVRYLFQVATEQNISNRTVHNQNLLSLSYGKIIKKDIKKTDGLLPASFDTYQIVNAGNIILRLTDLQNDHKSLRVGLVTQTGIITSAYTCLNTRESILPEYLYLQLHSYDIRKVFYGMGSGVRQNMGFKDMKKLLVLVPSLYEQQKIADFCYNEIDKIEKSISVIEKEITLITEYRKRLISDIVTGQLDVTNVEFEDVLNDTDVDVFVEELDNNEEVVDSEECEV